MSTTEPTDRVRTPPPPPPPPPPLPGDAPEAGEAAGRKRHVSFWKELPVLIVVAFVVALVIKNFLMQAFYIPSTSMVPTLRHGDRVIVEKVTYRFDDPERGDVVVFERILDESATEDDGNFLTDIAEDFRGLFGFPSATEEDLIKRIVAVGGDTVEGRDGKLFVNGEAVAEPYLKDELGTGAFGPLDVPEGKIFVMGDNRNGSQDSRSFGPVDEDAIVGRAVLLIWPPQNASSL